MSNTTRRVFKWIGILLGILLGIVVLAVLAVYYITQKRIDQVYKVQAEAITIPTGAEAVARGKHLVTTTGLCTECHGDNFSGTIFDNGPLFGRLVSANLTTGKGGIGKTFTDAQWILAIRHGIAPSGKSVVGMPSNYFYNYSDADLGAIIAYLKSLPPVDKEIPKTQLGPLARIFLLQDPSLLPAETIDHTGPRPPAPAPGVTVEYGKYLAVFCTVCHGENYAGGTGNGAGVNLTPGGDLANWSYEDFIRTLRTGIKPNGAKMDPKNMPWREIGLMTDDELKAIWNFLQSLPPVQSTPTPLPTKGP